MAEASNIGGEEDHGDGDDEADTDGDFEVFPVELIPQGQESHGFFGGNYVVGADKDGAGGIGADDADFIKGNGQFFGRALGVVEDIGFEDGAEDFGIGGNDAEGEAGFGEELGFEMGEGFSGPSEDQVGGGGGESAFGIEENEKVVPSCGFEENFVGGKSAIEEEGVEGDLEGAFDGGGGFRLEGLKVGGGKLDAEGGADLALGFFGGDIGKLIEEGDKFAGALAGPFEGAGGGAEDAGVTDLELALEGGFSAAVADGKFGLDNDIGSGPGHAGLDLDWDQGGAGHDGEAEGEPDKGEGEPEFEAADGGLIAGVEEGSGGFVGSQGDGGSEVGEAWGGAWLVSAGHGEDQAPGWSVGVGAMMSWEGGTEAVDFLACSSAS